MVVHDIATLVVSNVYSHTYCQKYQVITARCLTAERASPQENGMPTQDVLWRSKCFKMLLSEMARKVTA